MGGKPSSEVRNPNAEGSTSQVIIARTAHPSSSAQLSVIQHRSHVPTTLNGNHVNSGRIRARSVVDNVQRVHGSQPPLPNSSADENGLLRRRSVVGSSSTPIHHVFALHNFKCPVCHKTIPTDDIECHLVMCLTKPKISYNDDILLEGKGECVICFEDMNEGDRIARLPCLCIYHKKCIDSWFKVNRCCPEHPGNWTDLTIECKYMVCLSHATKNSWSSNRALPYVAIAVCFRRRQLDAIFMRGFVRSDRIALLIRSRRLNSLLSILWSVGLDVCVNRVQLYLPVCDCNCDVLRSYFMIRTFSL